MIVEYLEQTKGSSQFTIKSIGFYDQQEWILSNQSISHRSGGFFDIVAGDSINGSRLYLYQPQGAFNGMLVHVNQEGIWLLLQARVEPGNIGICQYGPTVQSTPANYLRVHNGKKTPYLEYFFSYQNNTSLISHTSQLDLGRSYIHKTKHLTYIKVDKKLEEQENFKWFNLTEINMENDCDYLYNTDLRSMLAVFDWETINQSTMPGRNKIHNKLCANRIYNGISRVHFKDLKSFQWGKGKFYSNECKMGVAMYKISTLGREVSEWYQPLVIYDTVSYFDLVYKSSGKEVRFLISTQFEEGIGDVITTSFTHYFKDKEPVMKGLEIEKKINQSEEGGRFYKCKSVYRINRSTEHLEVELNQTWVSQREMKDLLASSNTISIQLRCMMSFFLKELNPSVV